MKKRALFPCEYSVPLLLLLQIKSLYIVSCRLSSIQETYPAVATTTHGTLQTPFQISEPCTPSSAGRNASPMLTGKPPMQKWLFRGSLPLKSWAFSCPLTLSHPFLLALTENTTQHRNDFHLLKEEDIFTDHQFDYSLSTVPSQNLLQETASIGQEGHVLGILPGGHSLFPDCYGQDHSILLAVASTTIAAPASS